MLTKQEETTIQDELIKVFSKYHIRYIQRHSSETELSVVLEAELPSSFVLPSPWKGLKLPDGWWVVGREFERE